MDRENIELRDKRPCDRELRLDPEREIAMSIQSDHYSQILETCRCRIREAPFHTLARFPRPMCFLSIQPPCSMPLKFALIACSSLADSSNSLSNSATSRFIFFSNGSPSSSTSAAP